MISAICFSLTSWTHWTNSIPCPALVLLVSTLGYQIPVSCASASRHNWTCILCNRCRRPSNPKLMTVENIELIIRAALKAFSQDWDPSCQGKKLALIDSFLRVSKKMMWACAFSSIHMHALRVTKLSPNLYLGLSTIHWRHYLMKKMLYQAFFILCRGSCQLDIGVCTGA